MIYTMTIEWSSQAKKEQHALFAQCITCLEAEQFGDQKVTLYRSVHDPKQVYSKTEILLFAKLHELLLGDDHRIVVRYRKHISPIRDDFYSF